MGKKSKKRDRSSSIERLQKKLRRIQDKLERKGVSSPIIESVTSSDELDDISIRLECAGKTRLIYYINRIIRDAEAIRSRKKCDRPRKVRLGDVVRYGKCRSYNVAYYRSQYTGGELTREVRQTARAV